ncbi:AMP-binding protein [Robertkochia aurantiaca]|uniref:AMP-binding protein n=1 Tax=Robertkochia aurantiaca TaxID=2873700 RepID=UPI001CC9E6F0|nr:AMP-binding protein [Robertkochia sp. 3YJGBD-33]
MKPTYENLHLKFKLNGIHFNREELKEVAYSFVKEGKDFEIAVGDFLMDWVDDKDYIQVRTSGSTGNPRMIKIQKQAMVNSALASGDFFGIRVGDTALHCLPAGFIAGKMMLVRAMILGLEIDLVEPSLTPLSEVNKSYDFSAMIPLQVMNSLDKLNQIKKLIVGGAPVNRDLIEAVQNKHTMIFETYGMTETVTHIAAKKINNFRNAEEVESARFEVLPNIEIKLDDRGCLVIQAPDLAEEPVITNDLVKIHEDNSFEWLGRVDHVINSGGVKVIPELVEEKFAPYIRDRFFIYGIPDKELGQKVVLVVEGMENQREEIEDEISRVKNLEKFERPKDILFTSRFEETENSKVIREVTVEKILEKA